MHIFKKIKNRIFKTIRILAPGVIVGSADNDPSGIGTYSIAGAKYGLSLAWLMPFQIPLLFVVQEMCARIGTVTGQGLVANMKQRFAAPIIYCLVVCLVIANIFNIGANIAVMAECLYLIFKFNLMLWSIALTSTIVLGIVFIPYHIYSKCLFIFSFFVCAYVVTAFMVCQNWWEVLYHTVVPDLQFTKDFALVAAGLIGTTISPYLFFWQTSQSVEERFDQGKITCSAGMKRKLVKDGKSSVFSGMFFTQIVAFFIVVTSFCTLHKHGVTEILSAYDAAMALRPFAGDLAVLVFAFGILGSGILGISVLAGSTAYAVSELFAVQEGLSYKLSEAYFFYGVLAVSVFIGFFINLLGINTIQALLYAAVINCIVSVPSLFCVLILANDKEVMGDHTNSFCLNVIGWFTFCLVLASTILVFLGFLLS